MTNQHPHQGGLCTAFVRPICTLKRHSHRRPTAIAKARVMPDWLAVIGIVLCLIAAACMGALALIGG